MKPKFALLGIRSTAFLPVAPSSTLTLAFPVARPGCGAGTALWVDRLSHPTSYLHNGKFRAPDIQESGLT